ncbi:NAC transcription factor 47-like [Neltuma alba]|uniref:NAC transcription factor 47-like n=1 Tax=Neltuma alba TaxID=207710 RepID=UPI0010A2DFA1|nr:NAC transcription factor 47-like [Prosopis alba]XP_028785310.1 NAC transcription factor 47-like [Prosopis alba]XP_028785430.1 NAC transcription factor 47-like [Prosopis alba]
MPTGWRFCPEDHELIRDYLYNKVIQQQLPFEGLIAECDLYGNENPWEIWECFSEYVVKSVHYEDLYVFTKLKRKNAGAKNVERKVGLGSWEGEAIAKEIIINNSNNMNQSVVIGFMKRFRFEKSGTHQDGKWIMHEYSLHPSLFPSNYLHVSLFSFKVSFS